MKENALSIQSGSRLEGLDLARYIAFVGMVTVNFSLAMGANQGAELLKMLTSALEGRAAATFVVLAGIGLGLAGQKRLDQTVSVTIKRALFLLALGLLNATIFEADILHYYALYFLFGALLLRVGSWMLLGVIVVLNALFVILIFILNYDAGWNWTNYTYEGFWTPIGFVRNLFFNGWHPVVPWLGFMLFGIVLSRLQLSQRTIQLRLLIGGGLALAIAELCSAWLTPQLAQLAPELAALATTKPVPPMPLYTLAGIGAASMVTGGCLLISDWLGSIGILRLVTPAGRQSLTLYIAHIVLGMGALQALGMLGEQTIEQAVAASAIFCLLATAYAMIWNRWFIRGPIEELMRRIAG
ncbi:heparan-alpha-glucosaminide N-acetyltransferase domain-containing protein [Devosia sp. XK-2]|uniref:DUF418 domain-containing protein n=1 Tax=Devosia sp. XK-2 TaxID=3126689 RepID=UPI0030CE527C